MKTTFCAFGYVMVALSFGLHAQAGPIKCKIRGKGETAIVANHTNYNVKVTIKTDEVEIGKPSDERPNIIRSACTYSRFPCSLVDYIDIEVNGKQLFIPRSVSCDLADLNTAEIRFEQNEPTLMLTGGDASESYIVRIEFNEEQIKRKVEFSSMLPDEPTQETIYYVTILKDE